MRSTLLTLFCSLIGFATLAQETPRKDCATPTPTQPAIIPQDVFIRYQQKATLPMCVRVTITVFADDNGSNRATTDDHILRQFQNMVNQYATHNICFLLQEIRQVNNTDLNIQNVDSEESELNPYIVSNCLNIFIHNDLPGYNGNAYGIPNYKGYISMDGDAVESTSNISTMGHETGHVFGLYHTHETFRGKEHVARSGSCKNCLDAGDLLCDTPADPNQDVDTSVNDYLSSNTNTSCVYSGTSKDDCSTPTTYTPSTQNMMAYGRRACRSQFSAEQGTRLRVFLDKSEFAYLRAAETLAVPASINTVRNGGTFMEVARDQVTVGQSYQLTLTGTINQQFISKKIVIKPGSRFTPSGSGSIRTTISDYCN